MFLDQKCLGPTNEQEVVKPSLKKSKFVVLLMSQKSLQAIVDIDGIQQNRILLEYRFLIICEWPFACISTLVCLKAFFCRFDYNLHMRLLFLNTK